MIPIDDRIAGYHFVMNFLPNWSEVGEQLIARARAAGTEVSASGTEIRPRFDAITFSGTSRDDLIAGPLCYDVLGYRKDLGGSLVTAARITTRHPTYTFGLSSEVAAPQGPFVLDAAAALWLTNGALAFRPWSDERTTLLEKTLVPFDIWECIGTMAKFAKGEPSFGAVTETANASSKSGRYASPAWAPTLQLSAHVEDWTTSVTFLSTTMCITGSVALIIKR